MSHSAARLSRSSCNRIGILSIDRVSSRTSHGKGFRSLMSPSLPISVSMKPRGRSFLRNSERSSGEVSVISTTSRSASSPRRASSNSICLLKAGSAGVSANTTTGLATHLNAFRSISAASNMVALSASQRATASAPLSAESAPCAAALTIIADRKMKLFSTFRRHTPPYIKRNICLFRENRRGQVQILAISLEQACRKRG